MNIQVENMLLPGGSGQGNKMARNDQITYIFDQLA